MKQLENDFLEGEYTPVLESVAPLPKKRKVADKGEQNTEKGDGKENKKPTPAAGKKGKI